MTHGFKIVEEMISGLNNWMDEKGHKDLDAITGRAVRNVTEWQFLDLNYVAKAKINQDLCISCGRCYIACEDTSHQANWTTHPNNPGAKPVVAEPAE